MINTSSPTVSVIMAVFNGESTLERSIESILEQSYSTFEFLIADDGSVDSSWSIIHDFCQRDSRIQAIRCDHAGLTKTLNTLLAKSRGKYVARQDADDVSLPCRLEKEVEFLDSHSEVGLVATGFCRKPSKENCYSEQRGYSSSEVRARMIEGNFLHHASIMFRKDLVLGIGGYDETYPYAQDYKLYFDILSISEIEVIPGILTEHWNEEKSISMSRARHQRYYALKAKVTALWRMQYPLCNCTSVLRTACRLLIPDRLANDAKSNPHDSVPHIFVLEDSSKSYFGGGQKVTLQILAGLNRAFSFHLFDFDVNSLFAQKVQSLNLSTQRLIGTGRIVGGGRCSGGIGLPERLLFPLATMINAFLVLLYAIRKGIPISAILILATTRKGLLLAWLINRLSSIPYIYHAHSMYSSSTLIGRLMSSALKSASLVICVSEAVRKTIQLPNCTVVYNGTPDTTSYYRSIRNKKEIFVCSFSNLIKWKGIEYFVRSYPSLKNCERVRYGVYGSGPEATTLKTISPSKVFFAGFTEDVSRVLETACDIVVLPSIDTESCPMIALEAFSYGIPVITTCLGGQAELVKHDENGLHVEPANAKAIASAIDYLVDNPEVYEHLSVNALDGAKLTSEEVFLRKMTDILSAHVKFSKRV